LGGLGCAGFVSPRPPAHPFHNSLLYINLCPFYPPKFGFVFHFFIARSLPCPAQTDLACRSRGSSSHLLPTTCALGTNFSSFRLPLGGRRAVYRLPSGKQGGFTRPSIKDELPKAPPQYWRGYLRHPWGHAPWGSPPTYGRGCAFDAKKGFGRRWKMHVSRFQ
jgi:hypothetical protein